MAGCGSETRGKPNPGAGRLLRGSRLAMYPTRLLSSVRFEQAVSGGGGFRFGGMPGSGGAPPEACGSRLYPVAGAAGAGGAFLRGGAAAGRHPSRQRTVAWVLARSLRKTGLPDAGPDPQGNLDEAGGPILVSPEYFLVCGRGLGGVLSAIPGGCGVRRRLDADSPGHMGTAVWSTSAVKTITWKCVPRGAAAQQAAEPGGLKSAWNADWTAWEREERCREPVEAGREVCGRPTIF